MHVCMCELLGVLTGWRNRKARPLGTLERERENLFDFAVILMGRQFVMADEIYLPITPTSLKFMIISKTPLPSMRRGTGVL